MWVYILYVIERCLAWLLRHFFLPSLEEMAHGSELVFDKDV